jgi:apolipoprotein N-acyltransferase
MSSPDMTEINTAKRKNAAKRTIVPAGKIEDAGRVAESFGFALFAASLSGMLLWLCHFPMALGWLAWVALVPLVYLIRIPGPPRRVYGCAWLGGILFYLPALQWMRVADPMMYWTWLGLSLYCSLLLVAKVFLVRRLERHARAPLIIAVPLVWVAVDYWQAIFGTGFPWYFIGYTQHDALPVIQIADLGGVYLVTMLVAVVNVWLFNCLGSIPLVRELTLATAASRKRTPWMLMVESTVVLLAVGAALEYGYRQLRQAEDVPGPLVSLVQGNLDQQIKNEASQPEGSNAAQMVLTHYERLHAVATRQRPDPALIIWPETSFPDEWVESSPGQPTGRTQEIIKWLADRSTSNILLGINLHEENAEPWRRYNSAILLAGNNVVERYDKIHRVPFGEYVPFRDWLPFLKHLVPYDFDYSIRPGTRLTRFPLHDLRFGVLICYEDTDPSMAIRYVKSSPAADFLVNISNDGWFMGTSEHEEHLAICRFRAIETRRPIVRSVNMGISAIIDANGRVLRPGTSEIVDGDIHLWSLPDGRAGRLPPSQWAEFKKCAGVLTGQIPLDHRVSWLPIAGLYLPEACWCAILACLAWPFTRPRARQPESP